MEIKYGKQEAKIIVLLLKGYSRAEMSRSIGICGKTVDAYVASLRNKTGIECKKQLRRFFAKNGIQLVNTISLETELKFFEFAKNKNLRNRNDINFAADKFGITLNKAREILKKYKQRRFEIIISPPNHECYQVSFGKIVNV
ncbi:MAG: hypothetical protein V7L23_15185 [Nostoc sp.]|uniref:helix-turn-helix transcriptional regulator n=1 Tax=Nostoc sp. TaxID=1180 RepID=UPI002FF39BA3